MVMTYLKALVQLDLLTYHSNNMRRFALEDLIQFLQIPESEIAKFFDMRLDMDIMKIKKLFYESEDEFFEYLEV